MAKTKKKIKREIHEEEEEDVEKVNETTKNPYCSICKISFIKTNNYTRHCINVHGSGDVIHLQCPICITHSDRDKLFKYPRNLRKHIRNKHNGHHLAKQTMDRYIENAKRVPVPQLGDKVIPPHKSIQNASDDDETYIDGADVYDEMPAPYNSSDSINSLSTQTHDTNEIDSPSLEMVTSLENENQNIVYENDNFATLDNVENSDKPVPNAISWPAQQTFKCHFEDESPNDCSESDAEISESSLAASENNDESQNDHSGSDAASNNIDGQYEEIDDYLERMRVKSSEANQSACSSESILSQNSVQKNKRTTIVYDLSDDEEKDDYCYDSAGKYKVQNKMSDDSLMPASVMTQSTKFAQRQIETLEIVTPDGYMMKMVHCHEIVQETIQEEYDQVN